MIYAVMSTPLVLHRVLYPKAHGNGLEKKKKVNPFVPIVMDPLTTRSWWTGNLPQWPHGIQTHWAVFDFFSTMKM